MRTMVILGAGLVLLALCAYGGRWFGATDARVSTTGVKVFLVL